MTGSSETTTGTPRRSLRIPFLHARWTRGGALGLALFVALIPGTTVGCLYVVANLYPPHVAGMTKDPQSMGMAFESLELKAPDGVLLQGWYIPPEGEGPAPAIAICHGHKGRMDQFLHQAEFLHQAGYGVGMVNLRSHGGSGRSVITLGIKEGEDLLTVVSHLADHPRHRGQPLGVIGYSMGAVTSLRAARLDDRIGAVVADSPFHTLEDEAYHRIQQFAGPLSPYFYAFIMGFGCAATGFTPSDWDVTRWVREMTPRPIFLIHGESDNNIPPTSSRILEKILPPQGQAWYVPDSGHIQARKKVETEYERRVTEFFDRHLRPTLPDVTKAANDLPVSTPSGE